MLLGFLTGGQLGDLRNSLRWAREHGFDSISVTLPLGSKFVDLEEAEKSPSSIRELEEEEGVAISALGFYGNPLHPDGSTRKIHVAHFTKILDVSYKLEKTVVTGWLGKYPGGLEDNLREVKKVWPPMIRRAEDYGIRIAVENCPGNIMYRPDIWRRVFEELGSDNLGLEFDPSHLICQLIDPIRAADEFGDRIYHVHAKDAEVLWDIVQELGVTAGGWCPHRLPGFGQLDWSKFFTMLRRHGYDYAVSIEHEDPYFSYEEGLLLAKNFLARFFPQE